MSSTSRNCSPCLAPGETLYAIVSACLDSDIKDPPRKFQPKPSGLPGHLGGALERVAPFIEPAETVIDGIMSIGSGKVWAAAGPAKPDSSSVEVTARDHAIARPHARC